MKTLKVITLFSGYDSQCLALNRLGVPYELVAWCEVDRNAIKAHNALFPQWKDRNLGDVSNVIWSEIKGKIDLLTYSSPCQDFSNAGKKAGGEKGSGTRSGLLWECERAIGVLKPKYLLFENVPALVSEKFIDTFLAWAKTLEFFGYRNYWRCLNAKHYGVPQSRNRVFLVSIHGEGKPYYFPKKFKLERLLKDVLEKDVDERYYLSAERVRDLILDVRDTPAVPQLDCNQEVAGQPFVRQVLLNGDSEGNASTITTGHDCASHITSPQGGHKQMGVMEIHTEYAVLTPRRTEEQREARKHCPEEHFAGRKLVERDDGVCNTLTRVAKDNLLCIRQATKEGYVEIPDGAVFDGSYPTSQTRRGRLQDGGTVSPTVMSESNGLMLYQTMRIRRLTERELFRLMDVDDKDIDILLTSGIAKTQLAKMAGNSIVVNVLYHIFRTLLLENQPEPDTQLALF